MMNRAEQLHLSVFTDHEADELVIEQHIVGQSSGSTNVIHVPASQLDWLIRRLQQLGDELQEQSEFKDEYRK